jgi:hypothetical protein
MTDRSNPASDDIVVCQQQRGHLLVYILRPVAGPDQILVRSRQVALEQASSIASRRRVRAWLTSDGRHHVPLEEILPPAVAGRGATPLAHALIPRA